MTEERFKVAAGVLSADLGDGETALFHLGSQKYVTIDEMGRRIWDLLQDLTTIGEVAAALTAEFEVEQPDAEVVVREFLIELRADDLVEAMDA